MMVSAPPLVEAAGRPARSPYPHAAATREAVRVAGWQALPGILGNEYCPSHEL
jgi:hypothetical protein